MPTFAEEGLSDTDAVLKAYTLIDAIIAGHSTLIKNFTCVTGLQNQANIVSNGSSLLERTKLLFDRFHQTDATGADLPIALDGALKELMPHTNVTDKVIPL